jgi:hypothetical protein
MCGCLVIKSRIQPHAWNQEWKEVGADYKASQEWPYFLVAAIA